MTTESIVTNVNGNLFDLAPDNAVLVHACNTRGQWGAGIAKRFQELYPQAYKIYNTHCKSHSPSALLGTVLLIPPQGNERRDDEKKHWIACLFTSIGYGRNKSDPDSIVSFTRGALVDLKSQLEELKSGSGAGERKEDGVPGEVWACQFNSQKFGVPWERSLAVVEDVKLNMVIVSFAP